MSKINRNMRQSKARPEAETEFVVTEPAELLDFLLLKLSNRSRNNVKSFLTHREVFVDGRVVTQYNYALRAGQKIRIAKPTVVEEKPKNALNIIHEDDDIIVINKPAGLLSIATDKEKEFTAYHFLTEYVQMSDPKNRVFAVHRLDRDTSGLLMVAKNEKMKLALQDNWGDLVSERGYVAVVEGRLDEKSGTIQSWLKKTETLIMYSSHRAGDGLKAITHYQVLKESPEFSMLDIRLETGRKNQIRVHMKDIGHSVIGDKKYGAKTDPLKRLGLHANQLEFRHPFTDEVLCFEAKIPKSFTALFKKPTVR